MEQTVDIAIIGAGPVGGALALALAAQGKTLLLVDRQSLPPMEHADFDGRAYAIAAGCKKLLDEAGLWDVLPYAPCPIRQIDVTDGRVGRPASPLQLHFAAGAAGAEAFGWILEARALRIAINRRLHVTETVFLRAPAQAEVSCSEAGVRIAVGREVFNAKLAVAADGRESELRRKTGIPVTRLRYRQSAVVCAIAHEKPHDNVALEHFLPGGPFAQLPMSATPEHANLSAIVFTDRDELVARLAQLDNARFLAQVAKRLGDQLGAIELVGKRWTYPLSAMYAARYTDTRLALIGDAAHGVHPIAGQGLNLGLQDALALIGLLRDAPDPGAPALLAAYQAARRPANMLMLAATDALDRLFSTNNPALRLVRDLGLGAVNRMPRLKRQFMRTAMGQ